MFSRSSWALFGVRVSSKDNFVAALNDQVRLFNMSQYRASCLTKFSGVPSFGINPFADPRKDEALAPVEFNPDITETALAGAAAGMTEGYGAAESEFSLGHNIYAFWVVINDHEDVSDPKSKQEAFSYKEIGKPFKFLNKEEKKVIEANIKASAVASRIQFQVLVDFNDERVYAATANETHVGVVRSVIEGLGGEDFSLSWQFDGVDWPFRFLASVNQQNQYPTEMTARAEEFSRFSAQEIEKLDDRNMESIVSTYFALSELDTGLWAGLSTPARINLYKTGDPAAAGNPSVAFSLLSQFAQSNIVASAVTFQSLELRTTKKEEEKPYRTNIFTIDINANVNLTEVGVAALRGFDLPQFKREMKKRAKNSELSIPEYWLQWQIAMKDAVYTFIDNITETLKIDKVQFGLRPYESEEAAEGANG